MMVSDGSLNVNRSSRISKGSRRAAPAARPLPTVYRASPEEFRKLVQQLTGASSNQSVSDPPQNRLQRIAPPPLNRPAFLSPIMRPSMNILPHEHLQQTQNQNQQNFQQTQTDSYANSLANPSPGFGSSFSGNAYLSPISFSPMGAGMTPADNIWAAAGLQSPMMRELTELASGAHGSDQTGSGLHYSASFSSPTFQSGSGLVSPRHCLMGSDFGLFGSSDLNSSVDFSFPEHVSGYS